VKASFGLGTVAFFRSELDAAHHHWSQAARYFRRSEDWMRLGIRLGNLGAVAVSRGLPDEASRVLLEGLAVAERTGDRPGLAIVLCNLGQARVAAGRTDEGVVHLNRSLALCDELDLHRMAVAALAELARAAYAKDDIFAARDYLLRALDRGVDHDAPSAFVEALPIAATIIFDQGETQIAARLLGAARLWQALGPCALRRECGGDRGFPAVRRSPEFTCSEAEDALHASGIEAARLIEVLGGVVGGVAVDVNLDATARSGP